MARLFPQWLTDDDRRDPARRAEVLVYDRLAALPDNWTVLFRTPLKFHNGRRLQDREADFILVEPSLGLLVLEVKGGSISRAGADWYSTPLGQLSLPENQRQRHRLRKSPFDQATDTAKTLERQLDALIRAQRLRLNRGEVATAVCFPDTDVPDDLHLGPGAPRELLLDRADLDDLDAALRRAYEQHRSPGERPPGQLLVDTVVDLLAPSWDLPVLLGEQIEATEAPRRQLTEEQFEVLHCLESPRLLIAGCAGSGKTLIAAEQAHRLAAQGRSVLLTCYNVNLAEWLRSTLLYQAGLRVINFHRLCYESAVTAGVSLPDWSPELEVTQETYFNEWLPNALEMAAV